MISSDLHSSRPDHPLAAPQIPGPSAHVMDASEQMVVVRAAARSSSITPLTMSRPSPLPPIDRSNQPQPTRQWLDLYQRGILNVRVEDERSGCMQCLFESHHWTFPAFPDEIFGLYTNEEWERWRDEILSPYRNGVRYGIREMLKLVIRYENTRIQSQGLEWKLDDHLYWYTPYFILTWISGVRERYEADHTDARRVSSEPPPPSLNYQWYPEPVPPPVSDVPVARSFYPGLLMDPVTGMSIQLAPTSAPTPSPTIASTPHPPSSSASFGSSSHPALIVQPSSSRSLDSTNHDSRPEGVPLQPFPPASAPDPPPPSFSTLGEHNHSPTDEGQTHSVSALPVHTDKNQTMNSIPFTPKQNSHSVVVSPLALQYCSWCGARRVPGSGSFCSCGQRLPTGLTFD